MTEANSGDLPFLFGNLAHAHSLWLTLTNLCNIHCQYCFNYISRCHEHMPAQLAINIIKSQLQALTSTYQEQFSVSYFGGEPTLNRAALIQSINFLIDNDVYCRKHLMTNGVFNEATFQQLLGKGVDFQISYDGEQNNLRFDKKCSRTISSETTEMIQKLRAKQESVSIRATIHANNVKNMPGLINFCESYDVSSIQFGPICNFGDAKSNQVKQAEIDDYFEQFCLAYERSLNAGVCIFLADEAHFQNLKSNKMRIPLVWLPDGYVAMTITYASSKLKGAEQIIIGKYNVETGLIELNTQMIDKMKSNFIKNRNHHCRTCSIRDICCGNTQFTPFATDSFIPERDGYFCQIAIKMVKEFPLASKKT